MSETIHQPRDIKKTPDQSPWTVFSEKEIFLHLVELMQIPEERRAQEILADIRHKLRFWLPLLPQEVRESFLASLSGFTYKTKEDLLSTSTMIRDFLLKHSNPDTLQDIDTRTRNTYIEKGWTPINDLIFYVKKGDKIQLHLASARSKNGQERLRLAIEGLHMLAQIIVNLRAHGEDIQSIYGKSWMVSARPAALQRLGFEVTSISGADGVGIVRMSPDTLLERYGTSFVSTKKQAA